MKISLRTLVNKLTRSRQKRNLISSHWNSELVDDQWEVIEHAMRDVETHFVSEILQPLVADRNIDSILALDVIASDYEDGEIYRQDSFVFGLIKKFPWTTSTIDPELNAKKAFIAAEKRCRDRNTSYFNGDRDPDQEQYLLDAKAIIAEVLSDIEPESVITDAETLSFGPGSNFSITRKTTAYEKLSSDLEVTPDAVPLAEKLMARFPKWATLHELHSAKTLGIKSVFFKLVRGGRLSFVPKNAKTMRPIEVAPLLNTVMQKLFGNYIRSRLKKFGLNLRTAQSKHRMLARLSSITDALATIDLKSASDTISTSIVMELLPYKWFDVLDQLRSKCFRVDDKWYPYEKFSAMGNGYTFELETLIFWALAKAVVPKGQWEQVSVYGDDIIIPKEYAPKLISLLNHCGFDTNVEKSFISGPFKESCGGDYFNGVNVRPFYQDGPLTIKEAVLLHNYLVRSGLFYIHRKLYKFLLKKLDFVATEIRGPAEIEGDNHMATLNYDEPSFNCVQLRKSVRYPCRGEDVNYLHALYKGQGNSPDFAIDEDGFTWKEYVAHHTYWSTLVDKRSIKLPTRKRGKNILRGNIKFVHASAVAEMADSANHINDVLPLRKRKYSVKTRSLIIGTPDSLELLDPPRY